MTIVKVNKAKQEEKKMPVSPFSASALASYLLTTLFKLNADKIKQINNKRIRY